MGYMRHHAIIVTGRKGGYVQQARDMAVEIFSTVGQIETGDRRHLALIVSEIVSGATNGYASFSAFFIAPDGSKEWWDTSDAGDRARGHFIEWLKSDDAPYLDWAEVQFGDEEGHQYVTQASDLEAGAST